ncbi:MAG TPA: TlpA disulfide reductase family protein [Actinomycetes bacterium]|nr:TlpA disulfide reductase family protein [Actinomycetes bacterium]
MTPQLPRRHRRPALPLIAAAAALVLAGCTGSSGGADGAPANGGPSATTANVNGSAYRIPPCPSLPHARPSDLPDLTLPCLGSGGSVDLADLRGKPTVLNVWAAWCPPCSQEMPVLAAGMRAARDRVRFFGIQYKAPVGYAKQSAADFGLTFPSVQDTDGDRTVAALHAIAPPQTFFYRADGSLAGRHPGRITSRAELRSLVHQYLGVQL